MTDFIETNNEYSDIITWEIDRTPSHELMENRNNYFDLPDSLSMTETDDFIPFNKNHQEVVNIDIINSQFLVVEENKICCICLESRENTEICEINCYHKFCCECLHIHVDKNKSKSSCPLCRTKITTIIVQTQENYEKFIQISLCAKYF
jgi:hypothetical protein